MKHEKDIIICPLCGSEVYHQEVGSFTTTHVWICDDCPFVSFEFYRMEDIENLKKHLEIEKHL